MATIRMSKRWRSPEGATLRSGSGDGTIRIWDSNPAQKHSCPSRDIASETQSGSKLVCTNVDDRVTVAVTIEDTGVSVDVLRPGRGDVSRIARIDAR